jgi:ribonuclease J
MNYFQLNNLIDIKPKKGSVHIRSICEPFSEDMELDQKRIDNWLRLFGLYPEHKIHSSGHACGPAIFDMIQKINPKILFPIHTIKPEQFRWLSKINIQFPEYGKKIII